MKLTDKQLELAEKALNLPHPTSSKEQLAAAAPFLQFIWEVPRPEEIACLKRPQRYRDSSLALAIECAIIQFVETRNKAMLEGLEPDKRVKTVAATLRSSPYMTWCIEGVPAYDELAVEVLEGLDALQDT